MRVPSTVSSIPFHRLRVAGGLGLALLLCAVLAPQSLQAQTTYTVTNTNDAGSGSLRAAITNANDNSGTPADVIEFGISGSASPSSPHVIALQSALPEITDPVIIDGTSEPGHASTTALDPPVVQINGDQAGDVIGFEVSAANTTIKGLSITNFEDDAIYVTSPKVLIGENYIGLTTNGAEAGNSGTGVFVWSNQGRIGDDGSNGTDGNVVSGNVSSLGSYAIEVRGDNNEIVGNYVGTTPAGDAIIGYDNDGIAITGGSGNMVGGPSDDEANVVAGNQNEIYVWGAPNTVIQGNYVNTNPDGDDLRPGSDYYRGIRTRDSDNVQIGGTADGTENIVATPSSSTGILVSGSQFSVFGNYVGIHPDGTDLGGYQGVVVSGSNHTIGGTDPDAGNIVANSDYDGVVVTSDDKGHTIRGNAIFNNGDLGIDLDEYEEISNDAGDTDDGSNRRQNFPDLQNTEFSGGDVTVTYLVDSDPSASGSGTSAYPLTVDLYKADGDHDEGKAYLGTATYTADDYNGVGNSTCSSGPCPDEETITPPSGVSLTESDHVVATATDADGNTSEFSAQSSQLPVELASFDATQSGQETVELSWTTASETNNAGFHVQKKPVKASRTSGMTSGPRDASTSSSEAPTTDWMTLGRVDGAGTTSQSTTYTFSVQNLSTGTHQFRLKQVDLDGAAHVHAPTTVTVQMQNALRLSAPVPNPARQRTTLSFTVKDAAETRLTLYNVLGQQVATLFDGTPDAGETQTIELQTEDLSSGTYLVRLQTGTHTQTKRLTVVR